MVLRAQKKEKKEDEPHLPYVQYKNVRKQVQDGLPQLRKQNGLQRPLLRKE